MDSDSTFDALFRRKEDELRTLTQSKLNHYAQIHQCKDRELFYLKQQCAELQRRHQADLDAMSQHMKNFIAKKDGLIDDHAQENQKLRETISQLKEDFQFNLKLVDERDAELKEYEASYSKCRKVINDYNVENLRLQKVVSEQVKEIKQLGNTCADLEENRNLWQKKLKETEIAVESSQEQHSLEVESLVLEIKTLNANLKEQRMQMNTAQQQHFVERQNFHTKLASICSERDRTLSEIQHSMCSLSGDIQLSRLNNNQLQQELESKATICTEKEKEVQTLRMQINQLKSENEQFHNQLKNKTGLLSEMVKTLEEKEQLLVETKHVCASHNEMLDKKVKEIQETQRALKEKDEALCRLRKCEQEVRQAISVNGRLLEDRNIALRELEASDNSLRKELRRMQTNNVSIQNALADAKQEAHKLKEEISTLKANHEVALHDVHTIGQSKVRELEKEVQRLQGKGPQAALWESWELEMDREITALKRSFAAETDAFKHKISVLESEKIALQKSLDVCNDKVKTDSVSVKNTSHAEIKVQQETFASELLETQSSSELYRQQLDAANRELCSLTADNDSCKTDLVNKSQQLIELQQALDEQKAELSQKSTELEVLRNAMQSMSIDNSKSQGSTFSPRFVGDMGNPLSSLRQYPPSPGLFGFIEPNQESRDVESLQLQQQIGSLNEQVTSLTVENLSLKQKLSQVETEHSESTDKYMAIEQDLRTQVNNLQCLIDQTNEGILLFYLELEKYMDEEEQELQDSDDDVQEPEQQQPLKAAVTLSPVIQSTTPLISSYPNFHGVRDRIQQLNLSGFLASKTHEHIIPEKMVSNHTQTSSHKPSPSPSNPINNSDEAERDSQTSGNADLKMQQPSHVVAPSSHTVTSDPPTLNSHVSDTKSDQLNILGNIASISASAIPAKSRLPSSQSARQTLSQLKVSKRMRNLQKKRADEIRAVIKRRELALQAVSSIG